MMHIVSVQGLPFLACLVMLGLLSYVGIHVLKREVIFIDIALAQIAAVGAISAHVVFHIHGHSIAAHGLAFGSTLVAAAFFAIVRRRIKQIPLEAVIGVAYAVSAAAALFIVGVSPGGHVHIHEMLAGSILWATWSDVLWSAGVLAAVGLCFYLFRGPFRTISEGYEEALARGYATLGWDFLFYALIGVVITTAVRIAGVVVVFAFLIIPATLSVLFATGWSARLGVGWAAGAISAALGLLFANRYDFSVGPAIALFLGLALIVAGLFRAARVSRAMTAVFSLVIALALGGWFVSDGSVVAQMGGMESSPREFGGAPSSGNITHSHSHAQDLPGDNASEDASDGAIAVQLYKITDIGELEILYRSVDGEDERSSIVARLLEIDLRAGAQAALDFLEHDPPLLFRSMVVDELRRVSGFDMGYDIDASYHSAGNKESVAALKSEIGID
jgi:zinc/manganese transport system permease protein